MTVVWRKPWMQEFADTGRDGYDWRPAQVWDVQRSINEELRKRGLEPHNESIPVTLEMAASLHLILHLARLPHHEIPTVELLLAYMQREMPKYQALLEKHPDGMRDPEREKERAERRRLREERWAAQAKKGDDSSAKTNGCGALGVCHPRSCVSSSSMRSGPRRGSRSSSRRSSPISRSTCVPTTRAASWRTGTPANPRANGRKENIAIEPRPEGPTEKFDSHVTVREAFRDRRIDIPRHPRFLAQLRSVSLKPVAGGTWKI